CLTVANSISNSTGATLLQHGAHKEITRSFSIAFGYYWCPGSLVTI
ncbi:unnamed protein product, partial [Brassica rapa]